MKVTFKQPAAEGTSLFDMKHGDVFQREGAYYVRTWDGVTLLTRVIHGGGTLVPYTFLHFGSEFPQGYDKYQVIGRMIIEVD